MPSPGSAHFAHWLMQFVSVSFLAITFLQSGLDKVMDWSGNLSWLGKHFAKSPLAGAVPLLLGTLTVLEVCSGLCCALGALQLLVQGTARLAFYGASLSAFAFLALFLGQRVNKDYAGAAGLVPYFLVALAAMTLNAR